MCSFCNHAERRKYEVLSLAGGMSNNAIATAMSIFPMQVKRHMSEHCELSKDEAIREYNHYLKKNDSNHKVLPVVQKVEAVEEEINLRKEMENLIRDQREEIDSLKLNFSLSEKEKFDRLTKAKAELRKLFYDYRRLREEEDKDVSEEYVLTELVIKVIPNVENPELMALLEDYKP